jgi:hypothetical protein
MFKMRVNYVETGHYFSKQLDVLLLKHTFFFASLCQLHTMEYPYVQTEKFISGIQLCTLAHWMLVQ